MATIGNRLDRLEAATRPELPGKGFIVVHVKTDTPGVFYGHNGNTFTQDDLEGYDTVFKVHIITSKGGQ